MNKFKNATSVDGVLETNFDMSEVHISLISNNGGAISPEMIVEAVIELLEDMDHDPHAEVH